MTGPSPRASIRVSASTAARSVGQRPTIRPTTSPRRVPRTPLQASQDGKSITYHGQPFNGIDQLAYSYRHYLADYEGNPPVRARPSAASSRCPSWTARIRSRERRHPAAERLRLLLPAAARRAERIRRLDFRPVRGRLPRRAAIRAGTAERDPTRSFCTTIRKARLMTRPFTGTRRDFRGPRPARGVAAVEFVITVPILILLMLAVFEFGRAWVRYDTLSYTVRSSARFVSEYAIAGTSGVVNIDENSAPNRPGSWPRMARLAAGRRYCRGSAPARSRSATPATEQHRGNAPPTSTSRGSARSFR